MTESVVDPLTRQPIKLLVVEPFKSPRLVVMNPDEEWRSLAFMDLPDYEVSRSAIVRNATNGVILTGRKRDAGYWMMNLRDSSGKPVTESRYVLVARAFIPNPENKPTVDHIDGIRDHDDVDNLQWATHSEQNLKKKNGPRRGRAMYQLDTDGNILKKWDRIIDIKRTLGYDDGHIIHSCRAGTMAYGFYWEYCDDTDIIPGEIWWQVPDEDFEELYASTEGRFRKKDRILHTSSTGEYLGIGVANRYHEHKTLICHTVLAKTFLGIRPGMIVNHKNGIKTDNRLCNLEYLTRSLNGLHAIELHRNNPLKRKCTPVIQLTLEGQEIARYITLTDAEKATGISRFKIVDVCEGKKELEGNFTWRYADKATFYQ